MGCVFPLWIKPYGVLILQREHQQNPDAGDDDCADGQWPKEFFYNCVRAFLESPEQVADDCESAGA